MGALAAAGILAFASFMVLLAYAGDFRSGLDGRPHALSPSAVGFQGVVELIDLAGGRADMIRDPARWDSDNLVVAALEPMTDSKAVGRLVEEREGMATLIVLPKWSVVPHPSRQGWVRGAGPLPPGAVAGLPASLGKLTIAQGPAQSSSVIGRDLLEGIEMMLPRHVQTIGGDGIEPLVAGPGGGAVLARLGD